MSNILLLPRLLLSALFGICLFALYTLFTPQGAKWILSVVSEFTPYQITFSEAKGCLAQTITLENFRIRSPFFEAKAKTLTLSWTLPALLKKNTLHSLQTKDLVLYVYPGGKIHTPSLPQKPSIAMVQNAIQNTLPFPLRIENTDIQHAYIHWQGKTHFIQQLNIQQASSTDLSQVTAIDYQGSYGHFQAAINDTFIAKWDLCVSHNPFLAPFFEGTLKSQGNIFLPHKTLHDPNNTLQIQLSAPKVIFKNHTLENFAIQINGTLASHKLLLQGTHQQLPITSRIQGKLSSTQWEGALHTLHFKHSEWKKLDNTKGHIKIDWREKNLLSTFSLLLGEKIPVQGEIRVLKNKPYTLSGNIHSEIEKVSSLTPFFPPLANLTGKLQIQLALQGKLPQWQYTGKVILEEAAFSHPTLHQVQFSQLLLTLLENQRFSLQSQGGTWQNKPITLAGEGHWDPQCATPTLQLTLQGENLSLSDTPEYSIIGSPFLLFILADGKPSLTGKVFISEAHIQHKKNKDIIKPSQDVVIISSKQKIPHSTQENIHSFSNLPTRVEIILGDKVFYKGYGLQTKATGKFILSQLPDQVLKAKGKLTLQQGVYQAYGKKFEMDYGQVVFTGGPFSEPILDIRLQRKMEIDKGKEPLIVGIRLHGSTQNPEISFYSTPSLPESDILAYLIIGKPQDKMNEAQAELLFEAVSQLAQMIGKTPHDPQFNLAEKLNLDKMGFSKKSSSSRVAHSGKNHHLHPLEDTTFILGKQLSKHLYVDYSVGLLDSTNSFSLRYLLGKNLTLEAQTGTQGSSADLLLSFDSR